MPFLEKMSNHFRGGGYSTKESKSKTIYAHDEDYYPSKHDHRLYPRKDKIVDYEDNDYRNDEDNFARKPSNNGYSQRYKREEDKDVDWLYQKSKEKFASWDIKDFEDRCNSNDKKISNTKYNKRSTKEIADAEVEEIFINGESLSPSVTRRNGISHEPKRFGSITRHHERASVSPDRQNGKSRGRKTTWSEEEEDGLLRIKSEEREKPSKNNNNRDELLKEIENFGSLKKRNEKNSGLNLGFRAIVDKFRTKNDEKEKKEINQKNKKQELVEDDWRYDNGDSNGHRARNRSEKFESYPPKESKTEKNHRIRDHEYDPDFRSNGLSPVNEDDHHSRDRHRHESDRSKRRSYAFEASPENFDIRIQKYERARRDDPDLHRRNSFHDRGSKDSDSSQRNSSKDRKGTDVVRKSSLKDKDKDLFKQRESTKSKTPKPKVSERHSRPLTPPTDQRENVLTKYQEDSTDRNADPPRKSFSMKEWYESNRQFAAKYLKEHSKVKELSTSDVSAKDEFVFGSPKESRTLFEIENRDREIHHVRGQSFEDDYNKADNDGDRKRGSHREFSSVGHNEAATAVKIRTNTEEDSTKRRSRRRAKEDKTDGRRKRHGRESVEDDEEEEEEEEDEEEAISRRSENYERSFVLPTRKIWDYRDGGVHVTDVEEGQPCLQCGETCSGFLPHVWSLNGKLHRRHTTHSLLGGTTLGQPASLNMSPKGPSQEGPKMEVRVSCVPSPGAEPQGIRVRIPEPKKGPSVTSSPPISRDSTRIRCPSVSEKDFYRKTASLDRRDRYPTLSGAEIKRGLMSSSGVDSHRRRTPMLDRKNRFPTISGAELKRGFTIGKCPLEDGLDFSLAPWPGMKWACVRVLHLYCKVFDQYELFELIVRKNCTSCKCPKDAHDVSHDEWVSVRKRFGLEGDETRDSVSFDLRDAGLAWAPPGLPLHKVEEYFSMLPEISVPRLGTPGERHRDRQLASQLPKQDLAPSYCRHLDPQHFASATAFMAARNVLALDIGSVQEVFNESVDCDTCHEPIKYGSLAVSTSRQRLFYHPTCFRCSQCEELLVDLACCVHDDTLYCERHYAEELKPRCAACDELIFSGEYTKAMNKDWHSGHFCCWQCDESLTGQRYVLRDEHPYCIKCYESVFANGCEECHKIIGIDSKDLSYKDKHWHEACFLCNRCRVSLVDKQFGSKVDKIYCGNCYDSQFASRCDGCGEIFRAGTKKMEYKTRQWHEKCFCCVVCKNPIGTKSFIPREQEIYCAGCYEDKFATRCVKCNKIITSNGVTYKNEPWHRDCFTCSHCNQSLAGQRFTSRDEKPYCAECFGELFAKRCTACTKPITGIGGTRFISFEDRHWHNDCFICAGCKSSLVGRGFITDGEDIICSECAKQKLV